MANSLGTPETRWKVGQKVWLEAKNLPLPHGTIKLAPKRHGPFQITQVISPVAYQLKLPYQWNIHPVFHASLLTPYVETDSHGPNYSRPSPDLISGEAEYEVEQIRSHRRHGRRKQLQYLLKWKGYSESDNTWEPADQVHAPDLVKAYHRRHQLEHIKASTTTPTSLTHSGQSWHPRTPSSLPYSAHPLLPATDFRSSSPTAAPIPPMLTLSCTHSSAENAIAPSTINTERWSLPGVPTPLPASVSPSPRTILPYDPCLTTPSPRPMNPHLGLPQSPPSSSTSLSRQLQLLPAQVAQLSLVQSHPSQPSTYLTKTSPTSESKRSPRASSPPSNTAIPSIALKPTHSLAQIRSSKRRLLRSKLRSPTITRTPSVLTISLPTRDKSLPPSRSVWATHAQPSGFISEMMARWSFSPGRTIMRYHT